MVSIPVNVYLHITFVTPLSLPVDFISSKMVTLIVTWAKSPRIRYQRNLLRNIRYKIIGLCGT